MNTEPRQSKSLAADAHLIARHPVFDRAAEVVGYELRFASQLGNENAVEPSVLTSAHVINDAINVIGLQQLLGGSKAFLELSGDSLLSGDFRLFPAHNTVIQLNDAAPINEAVIAACRRLKKDGYGLLINRVAQKPASDPLLELADIVKLDFSAARRRDCEKLAATLSPFGVRLMAGGVDTGEDYFAATELGYDYLQGYFFCEPQIASARDIAVGKQNLVQFLREVNRFAVDFELLEQIVKREVSLSFKLLRYLNSVAVGLGSHVESIKQALVLLGERPLRKWASIVAMTCLAQDKPAELIVTTLVRARFCELLADHTDMADREFELFMTGLMSTLDVLLDREMDEVLMELPLCIDVKAALLGSTSRLGQALSLAIACERADEARLTELGGALNLSLEQISTCYQSALAWVDQVI